MSPISIIKPRSSLDEQYTYHKNWVALFPEGSLSLSRNLPLFGVRVRSELLPRKIRAPKFGKCFGWYNERACSRSHRCRLCGSTQHLESGHSSCDQIKPHQCPPKCANCHGPHPADSLECLLWPKKDNAMPTNAQAQQIRQAASAARLRLKAALCGVLLTQPTPDSNESMEDAPQTPTSVRNLFMETSSLSPGCDTVLERPNQEKRDTSPAQSAL
ncbi:hypothetical protein K3495_g4659 [Podosphaera aphanis]|nr:hypothetical protein K3495_g4659 [Podosphaera aphanis]